MSIEKEKVMQAINTIIEDYKKQGISRKSISDGWHSFEELYYHRMMLFSVICNQNKEIAWKSKLHHDGTMFSPDDFIVGVQTPEGQYSYHYHMEYWDHFDVPVLDRAPEYDGHMPKDITRLKSIL